MSRLSDSLDAALEWTVVGSFTRIGSAIRRRLDNWEPVGRHHLAGKVVVISGATSGIGLEAARQFARQGATVEIIARNAAKAEATLAQLRRETDNPNMGLVMLPLTKDRGEMIAPPARL